MTTATQPLPPTIGLLTAEEFVRQYPDRRADLVRGVVVEKPMPGSKHGKVANWFAFYLTQHVVAHNLGHVMTNDTTVVVARNPDTGRGADVLFVSYAKLPKGAVSDGPLTVAPDLVVEVRSPSDRWTELLGRSANISVRESRWSWCSIPKPAPPRSTGRMNGKKSSMPRTT